MKTEYDGMKILSTVLRENGITKRGEILEFVKGAELIKLKDRKKIDTTNPSFNYSDNNSCLRFGNQSEYQSDILVVSGGGTTMEDLVKKIEVFDKKIEALESEKRIVEKKIQYMQQSRAEKFNEKEYRAYQVLQTIKQGGLSDFDKAKLISELIK